MYGKIESEEGSVGYRTLPRLGNLILPRGSLISQVSSTQDIFMGQLASLISTAIEYVIAPDVRYYFSRRSSFEIKFPLVVFFFETLDLPMSDLRLLI